MQDIEEKIRTMDLKQAYFFTIGEEDIPEEDYRKMRYGIKVKFDIYDYIHNNIAVKQKSRLIGIGSKWMTMDEFYSEIEARLKFIKIYLLNIYKDESLTKPREAK